VSTLSLCMIVKDEEANIRRCLESVRLVADEIIIVDTGSSDSTKAICSEFTDNIFDYQWDGNFADARNFSIGKASSDWVLWMDADEELYMKSPDKLKQHLDREESVFYPVRMLHIIDTVSEYHKQPYVSYHHRLFRNRLNFKFNGAIHEKLILPEPIEGIPVDNCLEILHYGYLEKDAAKKAYRNLELLFQEKQIQRDDPWLDYHIAAELYRLQQVEAAFQFVNHSIVGFLSLGVMPPALAYKLKYDMLISMGNMEQAYQGIEKAIELYPDYVELHFYRGVILYSLKHYEAALGAFTYCLILGEANPGYLIRLGSGSFHAYHFLGECYTRMGRYDIAQSAYQRAARYPQRFSPAKL